MLRISELGVVMNTKSSEQEANTLWIQSREWQNAMNMITTIDRLKSCKTRQVVLAYKYPAKPRF
jgi:hypothetical protein